MHSFLRAVPTALLLLLRYRLYGHRRFALHLHYIPFLSRSLSLQALFPIYLTQTCPLLLRV